MTVAGDKPRLYIFCSHYSHVPTAAGTPRYEKPEVWFGKAYRHGRFAYAPRGTSPRATGFRLSPERRGSSRQPGPAGVTGIIYPVSESGTCFRTNSGAFAIISARQGGIK